MIIHCIISIFWCSCLNNTKTHANKRGGALEPIHAYCNTSGCVVVAKVIKIDQRGEGGGRDVLAGYAVRGLDEHDKKVGAE